MRELLSCIVFLYSLGICAQSGKVYNQGMLYVSPGTLMTLTSDFVNRPTGTYSNDGQVLMKGDFKNSGLAGFIKPGGLTRFEGDGYQRIWGKIPVDYYNVLFNNASHPYPFRLSGSMNIYGRVNFRKGIVKNEKYGGFMLFYPNSGCFNMSDESYVEGKVDKMGTENFTYPVGKSGYFRPAKIKLDKSGSALITGEYRLKNSGLHYDHRLKEEVIAYIDDREYWTIDHEEGKTHKMFVTLGWLKDTTPKEIIDAIDSGTVKITVVRWDPQKNMWVNEGGILDKARHTVTSVAVSGCGVFTLGLAKRNLLQACDVVIYNALTPNGDGINDFFRIQDEGPCSPVFHVRIFNRWGVLVFRTADYGEDGELFRGYSNGRATIDAGVQLPSGTYFYILEYGYSADQNRETFRKVGYLYLSGGSGN